MPAQKAVELLWSQVYTIQERTCLRFGAVSSMLVAFLMLMPNSLSDLQSMMLACFLMIVGLKCL